MDPQTLLDRHRSDDSAELCHDIRVPLTSIIANLELIDDELDLERDSVIAPLLARTIGAAARLQRMLDQHLAADQGAPGRHLAGGRPEPGGPTAGR